MTKEERDVLSDKVAVKSSECTSLVPLLLGPLCVRDAKENLKKKTWPHKILALVLAVYLRSRSTN